MKLLIACAVCLLVCFCSAPRHLRVVTKEQCHDLLHSIEEISSFKGSGQISFVQDKIVSEANFTIDWQAGPGKKSLKIYSALGTSMASLTLDGAQVLVKAGEKVISIDSGTALDSVFHDLAFRGAPAQLFRICTGKIIVSAQTLCDSTGYRGVVEGAEATVAFQSQNRSITLEFMQASLMRASPYNIIYFYSRNNRINRIAIDYGEGKSILIAYDWVKIGKKQ
ncbi:MAG: hypothetical protein PHC61_08235 [Chitinivibrionales bacterium]|nr:hypothetical protein [Chitinivibrionales bacterium]